MHAILPNGVGDADTATTFCFFATVIDRKASDSHNRYKM